MNLLKSIRLKIGRDSFFLITVLALAAPSAATADDYTLGPEGYSWYLPVDDTTVEILVEIDRKRLLVLQGKRVVAMTRIGVGAPESPTPTGEFEIRSLRERHFSSEIEGAAMPFSAFFDDRGNALHAGDISGHSNGCIRLPYFFAQNLFKLLEVGVRLVVR